MFPTAASIVAVMFFMIESMILVPFIITMVFVFVAVLIAPIMVVIAAVVVMVIPPVRIVMLSFRVVPVCLIMQMARIIVMAMLRRTVLVIVRHIDIVVPLFANKINRPVTRAVLNAVTPPIFDVFMRRVQINGLMNDIGWRIDNRRIRINQFGYWISITQMNLTIETRLPNLD